MIVTEKNEKITDDCDTVLLYVPKGYRAIIKAYAESKGMSINAYISNLIDKDTSAN